MVLYIIMYNFAPHKKTQYNEKKHDYMADAA
jgi:hypothetical protein